MPFILDVTKIKYEAEAYKNDWGVQCVALVQGVPAAAGSSQPPATKLWRRGIRVATANQNEIKKGTVIATFTTAGTYPTQAEGSRHAAIYVSHDSNGVTVIDQWTSDPPKLTPGPRTLPFVGYDKPRAVDKGDHYFVVELTITPLEGQTGVDQQTLGTP